MDTHPATIYKNLSSLGNHCRRNFLCGRKMKKFKHGYHKDEQDNFAGKPLTSKFSVPHSSKNSRIGYAAEPTVM